MERNYINLFKSGVLKQRCEVLVSKLHSCDLCPRECDVDRTVSNIGICHSGKLPIVSSYCVHFGEEPPLTGKNGVGNIFFGNCNLNCTFCQNYQISQSWKNEKNNEISVDELSNIMLELQEKNVSAIGLVSPSHFVPQILQALLISVEEGFHLPLIYNSNGYDKVDTLRYLENIIDIYLPDFKYGDDDLAFKYSKAKNYFSIASAAIKEMYRQIGSELVFDKNGVIEKGLIIRHLVLPNNISEPEEILKIIKETLDPKISISIMSQYYPTYNAINDDLLGRAIRESEYNKVLSLLEKYGFENGWIQDYNSKDYYRPDFNDRITPFKKAI
jgi:putative pyruvate formate lyase activating enzyme